MLICPEASSAQNSMAAVSADGSTVWVLILRLNSLTWWQTREGEEQVTSFLQAVGDGAVLEPPFADEGLAASLDLLARGGIDHVVVVGADLLVQAFGRVRQQVPVFMDRAALHRHAV